MPGRTPARQPGHRPVPPPRAADAARAVAGRAAGAAVRVFAACLSVALSLLVVSPALAQQQAEPIVGDPGDATASSARHPPDGASAAFYRSYARPERGKPRAEADGVWLLETDRGSGLAYPRL